MSDTIESMRTTYMKGELDEASAAENPFAQFKTWIDQVLAAELHEPNAVTVATVDAHGQPSARIVLLRGWDEHGFVFFTNYDSQKGHEIDGQHRAALLFYWGELERQVRIEGSAVRLSDEESDAYFAKRPRGHRLSAWASPQSRVVDDRAYLELRMEAFDEQYHDVEVPRPPYWGGYRIVPTRFEFWQGRPNRVHDRLVYRTTGHDWHRERIAP